MKEKKNYKNERNCPYFQTFSLNVVKYCLMAKPSYFNKFYTFLAQLRGFTELRLETVSESIDFFDVLKYLKHHTASGPINVEMVYPSCCTPTP